MCPVIECSYLSVVKFNKVYVKIIDRDFISRSGGVVYVESAR